MEELVSLNRIKAQVEASNWQDAIRRAGELLVKNDDIENAYIQNMIDSIKELGPYIVLTKGFALAHSAPSEVVKKTSISLINLKNSVDFGSNNDPVKVIMCLACVDKISHIDLLQKIASRLMQEGIIDRLSSCQTEDEIYSIINNA